MAERQIAASATARAFNSLGAFKYVMGPAGQGQQWHHIVEQTSRNVERFGGQAIHNTNNIVRLPTEVHQKISAYYSSKQAFTGGQTVRAWLSRQSFQDQKAFGQRIMQQFQERAQQQGTEDALKKMGEMEQGLNIKPF